MLDIYGLVYEAFNKAQPELLKTVLMRGLTSTFQDVVILYIAIKGQKQKSQTKETWVKKIYPDSRQGQLWSGIQLSTASATCAVIDIVLANPKAYQRFIRQKQFRLTDIVNNQFGTCFKE